MEDAARRLIGVMDERAKKRKTLAGGGMLDEPAKIADQPTMSLVSADEAGTSWSDKGVRTLDGSSPTAATDAWEVGSGSRMGGGRAVFTVGMDYVFEKISPKETARPSSGRLLDEGRSHSIGAPEDG